MIEITPPVRVRFAPSPTGFLHIGGVRTALFNWLFARHYGGQFILRVEDTDEKRYVPGAAEDMMYSLRWVGIDWDEGPDIGGPYGPYVQTERHALGIYQQYIDQLLSSGKAYKSFVTEQELEQMRADAAARGIKSFRYRGAERDWTPEQVAAAEASGRPYTVRLKTPLEGTTSFSDLIRGGDKITVNNSELQDIVLVKSSGMPLYHLAHLIDDHEMRVTHVLRAEEWVPSAPYHLLLYQAFGWTPPVFAHVPAILRQDGKGKLSKRKDDVATNRFWERGYLPAAMFNYLALQGWSYDDHTEIMSRDEVVERFTIDRVQPSPARWNPDKLKDMNGIYIRKLSTAEVAERIMPFLSRATLIGDPPSGSERAYVERLIPLVHERLEELGDAPELLEFFFRDVAPAGGAGALEYDLALLIPKKMDAAGTAAALAAAHAVLSTLEPWTEGQLEETLRALAEELELKPGQLFGAIRVAVTGRTIAPPLFETLAALGKDRSLARIAAARDALSV
ncbi:MAG TPA: glutamate--tRNA ligase [Roseiflexaceae bacterium]|nr:glutamate--tRNA ligase [Roseiflexaceae bacterium]